jgi:hypothetical protein
MYLLFASLVIVATPCALVTAEIEKTFDASSVKRQNVTLIPARALAELKGESF